MTHIFYVSKAHNNLSIRNIQALIYQFTSIEVIRTSEKMIHSIIFMVHL
jgi:hypothetical protein